MPTRIEWTDEVWNPATGCTPVSAGCANCYARRMARRLAGRHGYPPAPHHFDVTLHPDRLDEPLRWRKPRRVFVCSMGDLFHEDVPNDFRAQVFDVMAAAEHYIFQILTKRPENIRDWEQWMGEYWPGDSAWQVVTDVLGRWPDNIWLGGTVESRDNLWRVGELLKVRAAVHFVSLEPLLGSLRIAPWLVKCHDPEHRHFGSCERYGDFRLDWVIVGGETGPGARPMHPDWVRNVRDQCIEAGVPFFFKQWGEYTPCPVYDAPDMSGGRAFYTPGGGRMAAAPGNRRGYKWLDENLVAYKCGKKAAGHLLDGQEWRQFPGQVAAAG